jgi:DNA-directed RNA polymerase specialized sigma24 family protein
MDKETFDIINRISEEHSGPRKKFGYLTEDDLKSEIWAICLDKLKDFDRDRGELEHFLRVLVKNRLINRYKDVTKSVRPPCPRCEFYDPDGKPSCVKFGEDKHLCNKWRNYELSVESRNSLINASEQQYERSIRDNTLDKLLNRELQTLVFSKIGDEFRRDLNELVSGGKISKQRIKKLKKEILRIIQAEEDKKFTPLLIQGKKHNGQQET